MNLNRLCFAATLALAVASIALHVSLRRRIDTTDLAVSQAEQKLTDTRAENSRKRKAIATARAAVGPVGPKWSGGQRPGAGKMKATAKPPTTLGLSMGATASDPQLRGWFLQGFKDRQQLSYGRLLARFGLTAEQCEKYYAIQTEAQEQTMDFLAEAEKQGFNPNDPGLRDQRQMLQEGVQTQLQALFGSSYGAWREAARTVQQQSTVAQLMEENFEGDGAFSPAQADQLTQVLARHTATGAGGTQYDWPAVMTEAQAVLAPQQLAGFELAAREYQANAKTGAMERGTILP